MTSDDSLRYPIGGPRRAESFTPQERSAAIEGIRQLPQNLRSAVAASLRGATRNSLSAGRLDSTPVGSPCRRQPHECLQPRASRPDRRLADDFCLPGRTVGQSWKTPAQRPCRPRSICCRRSMSAGCGSSPRSMSRTGSAATLHPANGRQSVEQAVILYDWHGRHHTAHVTQLSARMGW